MSENLSARYEYLTLLCDSSTATRVAESTDTILNHPYFEFTNETFQPAGIKVVSAIIPFTYHVINSTNNTLILNGFPIDIPSGTYTANQLCDTLQTLFTDAVGGVWTITFNDQSLKFNFEWSSTFFSISFGLGINQDDSLKDILGFNDTVVNSEVLAPYTLQSQKIATVTGPSYLFINSKSIGQTVRAISNNLSGGRPVAINQIAKIPINVQPGGFIFFEDPNPQNYYDFREGTKFNGFDLCLSFADADETPIDLNQQSFSVTISLLQYRRGGQNMTVMPTNNSFMR
jgi:hypothetical protein